MGGGVVLKERIEKLTPEERRESLFHHLAEIVAELRRDHGLESLIVDSTGKIEAEVVRREKISR